MNNKDGEEQFDTENERINKIISFINKIFVTFNELIPLRSIFTIKKKRN